MAFQMMTRVFEVSKEKFDLIQSGGDYYINFAEWEIHTPEEVTALVEEARAEFTEDLGYDDLDIRQELGLIHIEECAEIFLVYECYGIVTRDGLYHCVFAGTF
jgi:hypothetical protein